LELCEQNELKLQQENAALRAEVVTLKRLLDERAATTGRKKLTDEIKHDRAAKKTATKTKPIGDRRESSGVTNE
jgi:hypothetical protein